MSIITQIENRIKMLLVALHYVVDLFQKELISLDNWKVFTFNIYHKESCFMATDK